MEKYFNVFVWEVELFLDSLVSSAVESKTIVPCSLEFYCLQWLNTKYG